MLTIELRPVASPPDRGDWGLKLGSGRRVAMKSAVTSQPSPLPRAEGREPPPARGRVGRRPVPRPAAVQLRARAPERPVELEGGPSLDRSVSAP
jgi:hypothetical protein